MDLIKLLAGILIVILVIAFISLVLGKLNWQSFWVLIIIIGLISWLVIPRLRKMLYKK